VSLWLLALTLILSLVAGLAAAGLIDAPALAEGSGFAGLLGLAYFAGDLLSGLWRRLRGRGRRPAPSPRASSALEEISMRGRARDDLADARRAREKIREAARVAAAAELHEELILVDERAGAEERADFERGDPLAPPRSPRLDKHRSK
jgi:hypothetical protein